MSHDEELEIVKNSLDLEVKARGCFYVYDNVLKEKEPVLKEKEPKMQNVKKQPYPRINPDAKMDTKKLLLPIGILLGGGFVFMSIGSFLKAGGIRLLVIIGGLFGVGGVVLILGAVGWFIYSFSKYFETRKKSCGEISKSKEYLDQCAMIDRQNELAMLEAKNEYEEKMNYYHNVTVANYNKELNEWKQDHMKRLSIAEDDKNNAEAELHEYYESTRVIPAKYHNIAALEYIYSMISSSQYSLKECIDDYEQTMSRNLEEERLRELQYANDLADEQNRIAEKSRRDQNISNVVRGVQHHNTNKMLKKLK